MVVSHLEVGSVCILDFSKTKSNMDKAKFMIDTGAGVIDADYRGIVFVLLYNLSDKDFQG
jgi:dUTPase